MEGTGKSWQVVGCREIPLVLVGTPVGTTVETRGTCRGVSHGTSGGISIEGNLAGSRRIPTGTSWDSVETRGLSWQHSGTRGISSGIPMGSRGMPRGPQEVPRDTMRCGIPPWDPVTRRILLELAGGPMGTPAGSHKKTL